MPARKPAFKLVAPRVPEFALHRQIADALRVEIAAPGRVSPDGACWFSIDIAAFSGSAPGLRTTRGIVAGIPDILVVHRGRAHWIEVKAEDGSLSPAQQAVWVAQLLAGAHCAVVRDAGETLAVLDAWGIPRAHRIRG